MGNNLLNKYFDIPSYTLVSKTQRELVSKKKEVAFFIIIVFLISVMTKLEGI